PDSDADGVVQADDVITALSTPSGEQTIETYQDLSDALAATPPGTTVTLTVERDDTATDLEITTGDDGSGGSVLGVFLDADFDFPIDVHIEIDNVGGPSAGTMFALGILDLLNPEPMAGGQDRKSTRLNSSHVSISYAVFCLKKKNNTRTTCT